MQSLLRYFLSGLEVVYRAVIILRELAMSAKPQAEILAEQALQRLAKKEGVVGKLANSTLPMLAEERNERAKKLAEEKSERAKHKIIENGGRFIFTGSARQLKIGAGWKGGDDQLKQLRYIQDVDEVRIESETI